MKAMILTGLSAMEPAEAPEPKIENPTDVRIRLASVGICGSDVHYYSEGRIGSQVVQYPFRVGHECSGIIEEIGPGVKNLLPGDSVAIDPAMPCWKCDQCRAGRPHTCRNTRFLGTPGQSEGCLCEHIVMPAECCFPVAASTTFEQAALVEPLSIGYYAATLSAPVKGMRVGILGAGPIGLSVMLSARALGAERIYMTDRLDYRAAKAAAHGADWSGNPEKTDVVSEILDREPLQLDTVFECAGEQETINQGIALLKPGGKLILVGIPRVDVVSFNIDRARRHEVRLQNVRRQNGCVEPALALLQEKPGCADFMVTHRIPFEKTKEGLDLVAGYKDGVVKAMIQFV